MEHLDLGGFAQSLLVLVTCFLVINALFIARVVAAVKRKAVTKKMLATHAVLFAGWFIARLCIPCSWGDGELFVTCCMLVSIHLFVLALQAEWEMHKLKISSANSNL